MLLIALSLPGVFYLPYEKAKPWYGISADSAGRGLRELEKAGFLVTVQQWVKNHRSDTGWVEQRRYMLAGPYAKTARKRRVGKNSIGPVPPALVSGAVLKGCHRLAVHSMVRCRSWSEPTRLCLSS